MQKSLGAGAAGLIDHNERSRRELVLIADASHQTRHLIRAAAGTSRYHELNRLGRLPSDRYGLSNKELNDKSRRGYSTQATYELHRTLLFFRFSSAFGIRPGHALYVTPRYLWRLRLIRIPGVSQATGNETF